MKLSQLNGLVRSMVHALLNDGFKKKPICDCTLGNQSAPQFDRFLSGIELGVKPFERFFDGLGYDILIVPVKKDNADSAIRWANEMTDTFLEDSRQQLLDYLENRQGQFSHRYSLSESVKADLPDIFDVIQQKTDFS